MGNCKNISICTWTLKRGETVELVNIRQGRQYQIIMPDQSLLLSTKNPYCSNANSQLESKLMPSSLSHAYTKG